MNSLNALKSDLKELDAKKAAVDAFVQKERDQITADRQEYESNSIKNSCSANINGIEYKEEQICGKTAYPVVNDDCTRIEYRDSYGNLLGCRTWENKYTETTNIEVGQCYRFERNTMTKVTNCFRWS